VQLGYNEYINVCAGTMTVMFIFDFDL